MINDPPPPPHWSLLIYSKLDNAVFHFDSLKGLNKYAANLLISNIGFNVRLVEVNVTQQSSSFECGLHLLVNCKFVMVNYFSKMCSNGFGEFVSKNFKLERLNELKTTTTTAQVGQLSGKRQRSEEIIETLASESCNSPHNSATQSSSEPSWSIPRKVGKYAKVQSPDSIELLRSKNIFDFFNNGSYMHEDNSESISEVDDSSNSGKDNGRNPTVKPTIQKKGKCGMDYTHDGISIEVLNNIYKDYPDSSYVSKTRKKLNILSDSHGRNLSRFLSYKLPEYEVCGHVYPSATLDQLVEKIPQLTRDMGIEDILLIIGGSNDISTNKNYDITPSLKTIFSH